MKILIIEPNARRADIYEQNLRKYWKRFKDEYGFPTDPDMEFIHVKGSDSCDFYRDHMDFYNENLFSQLQELINEGQVGILLNPILRDRMSEYYDSYNNLASDVWCTYHDDVPIYIVTTISDFFVKSEEIMGADLSDQFIPSCCLQEFQMDPMYDKMFKYYTTFTPQVKEKILVARTF